MCKHHRTCMLKMQAILMAHRMPSRHSEATSGSSQSCSPTLNAASRGVQASWNTQKLEPSNSFFHSSKYLLFTFCLTSYLEHGPDMLQVCSTEEGSLSVAHGLHQSFSRLRHLLHLHVVQQTALLLAGYA